MSRICILIFYPGAPLYVVPLLLPPVGRGACEGKWKKVSLGACVIAVNSVRWHFPRFWGRLSFFLDVSPSGGV